MEREHGRTRGANDSAARPTGRRKSPSFSTVLQFLGPGQNRQKAPFYIIKPTQRIMQELAVTLTNTVVAKNIVTLALFQITHNFLKNKLKLTKGFCFHNYLFHC